MENLKRFGTLEDLLGETVWLFSPAVTFGVGISLPADGGEVVIYARHLNVVNHVPKAGEILYRTR